MTPKLRRAVRRAALGVVLALGGTLAVSGGVGPAAAANMLIKSCPYTIMTPGTYVLARDLICPGTAISIKADDVHLSLGGHSLTAGETDEARSIGIFAHDVADLTISGPGTITHYLSLGFRSPPSVAILLNSVSGTRVKGVTITENERGIDISECASCMIVGNRADHNDFGISVVGTDTRLERNQANDNNWGIGLSGTDSFVRNNTADSNSIGIAVGGTGTRVERNQANGNHVVGIFMAASEGARLERNEANGNHGVGILVQESSVGNRLERNQANGNGGTDLQDFNLDLDPPACVNTWRGNRFATDNEGDGPGAGCIR